MKKLFLTILSLLCCLALATPVFADVIIPSNLPIDETIAAPTVTEAARAASASSPRTADPMSLYLMIGGAAVAAGLLLWLLLRKRAK